MEKPEISIGIDTNEIDTAIEKANRLVELLQEASSISASLFGKRD